MMVLKEEHINYKRIEDAIRFLETNFQRQPELTKWPRRSSFTVPFPAHFCRMGRHQSETFPSVSHRRLSENETPREPQHR